MFRKVRPNLIESDSGYFVELVAGVRLIYREGGKKVTFATEGSVGPILFKVRLGEHSDSWDPTSDTVKISDETFRRIGDNIREAYRSQGIKVEVHTVPPEVREAAKRRISMCRKTKPNLIESDLGFSVGQVDFSKLEYGEGDRKVTLTIEHLTGPAIFVVYLGGYTDRWDPPFDTVVVSDDEWRRIGRNIREAYRSQGCEIEFQISSMSPEEKEAFKRALEHLKRPPATSFAARLFTSVKRTLERLKRTLSQHWGRTTR